MNDTSPLPAAGFLFLEKFVQLLINGREEKLTDFITLADFFRDQDLNPDHLVVELNTRIIPRQEFPDVQLREGDKLEVLRFIGGG